MKKGYIKLLSICLVLIALISINNILNIFNEYTYIFFLLVSFIATVYIIGYEKDDYIYKKDLILIAAIVPIFYLMVMYGLGLVIGFFSNGYNLRILNILKNIFIVGFTIILEELLRYNLIKKGSRSLRIMVIIYILFTLANITLIVHGFNLENRKELVEFICCYLFPIAINNILLMYLSYKAGFKPCIVYLLIINLYLYFMPIIPGLVIYMDAIFKILLSSIMVYFVYILTKKQEKKVEYNLKITKVITAITLILIVFMIGINSRWLKYYSVTVGSGSMTPNLKVGDVAIIEKLNKKDIKSLEVGDVILYKNGDKMIIHRIESIKIDAGNNIFITKGDANTGIDFYVTREEDVLGIARFKIPFIGMPTIWLNQFVGD